MSAPVLLGCAAAALVLALPVVTAAGALEARQRAAGGADAAALAAADAANGWIEGDPCGLAARVAVAVEAELVSCRVDERIGEARVVVRARSGLGVAEARARAGPRY